MSFLKETDEELHNIIEQLRDEMPFHVKRHLRRLWKEEGSLISEHFGLDRGVRNWLIGYGVDPVRDGEYWLDEIWIGIALMVLGLMEIGVGNLEGLHKRRDG